MLVQARRERLRLFTQHHHALASGTLAHAWVPAPGPGPDGEGAPGGHPPGGRLPHRVVLAAALHDVAWREIDRMPVRDPGSGRPCGFTDYPLSRKLEAYRHGLDAMEEVDPWIGLLGSLHYASFLDRDGAAFFLEREEQRRRRLMAHVLRRDAGGRDRSALEDRARADLAWLKFLDGLSLRICLTPPPVPAVELPPWMSREDEPETPAGRRLELGWHGPSEAAVRPWPFSGRQLELELPWRELPAGGYPDGETLREAWGEAERGIWRPRLVPG